MSSLTIYIIRHAEKPDEAWPGPGLTLAGGADEKSLVVRGWQRSGAWATLFGGVLGGDDYLDPDAIYAADPAVDAQGEQSQRPLETITPLAEKLGLKPNTRFAQGSEEALAAELIELTGVVLVSWEHKKIVTTLLPALAIGAKIAGLPTDWPGDRFDIVLRFFRTDATANWQFSQLRPRLLSGDSDAKLPN